MNQVVFEISDRMLLALGLDAKSAEKELRLAAAMKLCELGRLSTGAAAELAGVPKPEFLSRMGDFRLITFDYTREELEEELKNIN